MAYVERVASRAASVRLVRAALTVLAFPFFVIGFLVALLLLVLRWSLSACVVGFEVARERADRRKDDDA